MFFKHAQVFRLPARWKFTAAQMIEALTPHTFTPASKSEAIRQGWAPPREHGDLVHSVGGQWLLQLKTEKKLLPATVINQVAKERAAEMEEAQGFAPGRKAMKELKERVADELLPRAFDIKSTTNIWIDPEHGWLVVDAASPAKADEAIKLLLKAVDRMPLESLRVNRSPVGVMTEWLQADDAPAGFTVDQDTELRATGESKAAVRYVRHTLEADEVRRHIAAGKQCTRLAMTWDSKISFTLTESLAIKNIKPLDVLKEGVPAANDAERFDGDFMLMAGELARMLSDIVEALGGEAEGAEPAAKPAPRAAAGGKTDTSPAGSQGTALSLNDHVAGQLAARGLTIAPRDADATGTNGHGLGAVPAGDGSAADPLYDKAVEVVRSNRRASISLVQRHLRIGYNRAARLLEAMEGSVVGPMLSNGNRELLGAGAEA